MLSPQKLHRMRQNILAMKLLLPNVVRTVQNEE